MARPIRTRPRPDPRRTILRFPAPRLVAATFDHVLGPIGRNSPAGPRNSIGIIRDIMPTALSIRQATRPRQESSGPHAARGKVGRSAQARPLLWVRHDEEETRDPWPSRRWAPPCG